MRIYYFLKFFIIIQLLIQCLFLFLYTFDIYEINNIYEEKIEDIDSNILSNISTKLEGMIELTLNEQKFLNGLIRKYKPKKIVEIGVSAGGSAAIILNAIKEFSNAKLYSIDRYQKWYRNSAKSVGWYIKENFPDLGDKWTLLTGKNTAEFIEIIGNNIDFVFIDTFHFTPGEMLNWLEILPFLKEEAIVVFHDAFMMFLSSFKYKEIKNYSNNQLLCYIRGKLILPTYGDKIFSRNIGALKLARNQKKYYQQYFLALGNQWQYFPEEKDLLILKDYYRKYFGQKYVDIFNDAVNQNRDRFKKKLKNI